MQSPTDSETSPSARGFLKPTSPVGLGQRPLAPQDFEESTRPGKKRRLEAPPMTAAAAMAEQQPYPPNRTSPNPASEALSALMGVSNNPMSKPVPASSSPATTIAATTISEPLTIVAENIQKLDGTPTDSQAQTSPVSISSLGTIEGVTAPSALTTTVHSPSPMDESARLTQAQEDTESTSPTSPEGGMKAFSYPAPALQAHLQGERRHMSLPHSGLRQGSPRSPAKKHRCPYCSTEFTRHHNLKSHLLTHSQEKPYVCATCQSRFRRLHDLKRHTKLHTGERPHICHKCGRKFARGDALARHNKGHGGCAGRRSSMGSYNGDEDFEGNDDSMDGVMYNEPEGMEEEDEEGNEKRPGIKRHAAPDDESAGDQDQYSRLPSTYPPIQGRPPGGMSSGAFPPRTNYTAPGSGSSLTSIAPGPALPYPNPTPGGSTINLHPHGPGPAAVLAQNPLSESPKPLSPRQNHPRPAGQLDNSMRHARSPSIGSPLSHQAFGRGASGRTASGTSVHPPPGAPQLPPPHALNPPDARYTLPSQGGPAHPPTQPSGPPTHISGSGHLSSHSNSLSSHGQGSGENVGGGLFVSKEERLWAYVKSLESRMDLMQQEINGLRGQLAAATGQPPPRVP